MKEQNKFSRKQETRRRHEESERTDLRKVKPYKRRKSQPVPYDDQEED